MGVRLRGTGPESGHGLWLVSPSSLLWVCLMLCLMAIKRWLGLEVSYMYMVLAAHCAMRLPWTHLAITLLPAKGVVMWFPTTTNYVMSLQSSVSELIWVSRWKWVAMSPPIAATHVQLTFWFPTGSWANQQLLICQSHPRLIAQFFWNQVWHPVALAISCLCTTRVHITWCQKWDHSKMEKYLAQEPIGEGDLNEQWKRFKWKFEQFLVIVGKEKEAEQTKLAIWRPE